MKSRLVLACVFALTCACGSNSESPPQPASSTAPVTPAPSTEAARPPAAGGGTDETRALLTRVFHLTQTRKMRMRATITIPSGPRAGTSTIVAENIPPNTKHVTMGGNGHEMHMLMSGTNTWMRQSADAPWRRLPFAPQAGMNAGMPQMEERILASLERGDGSLTRQGNETVAGHDCSIYHITWTSTDIPGQPPTPVDGRVWIGDDGLAYRVSSTTAGRTPMTFEATYEYDESINIPLPE